VRVVRAKAPPTRAGAGSPFVVRRLIVAEGVVVDMV
jgi:hypothetical protein